MSSAFLGDWNMYTGIAVGTIPRNPRKSPRIATFAGTPPENPHRLDWVPQYQHLATECPSCQGDLHNSSGWGARTCLLCGYIEGMGGYHVYPRAYTTYEWCFIVGQLYQQLVDKYITYSEFREELRQLTFIGSVYRPYGEEPLGY